MIETENSLKTLLSTLKIKQTECDYNLKITVCVLHYILTNKETLASVKSSFANKSVRVIKEHGANYIKSLIEEVANEVESDEFPLFYDIINCSLEIIDYEWIAMNIVAATRPDELGDYFNE